MTHEELALAYAADGLPVFPCRPNYETVPDSKGKLVEKKPKSPLTQYGFKEATTTERIINRWWSDRPEALIGTPTGERSGFWVLDIDIPTEEHMEDGRPWLERMEAIHGALDTREVRTASGGRHFFWKHVDGVRNKAAIAPGVDTRGEGGYACMPGSVMPDGKRYEWANDKEIADAPAWLLEIVTRKPPELAGEYRQQSFDQPVGADEVRDLLSFINPDINYSDWVSVLMALHSEFGAEGLPIAEAWSSRGSKYRRGEVEQKWKRFRSGAGVGMGTLCELARQGGANLSEISLRHRTDTAQVEVDSATLRNIQNIIRSATEEGAVSANEPANPVEESGQQVENHKQSSDSEPAKVTPGTQLENATELFFATPFKWIDPKTLPRREFAFGTHYIRKYVSVTVSPGGLGKTSNSIVEALSMASGRALAGVKPPQRLRVWLFNAEDPRDEMERRIMAACLHYGLSPEDIEGQLFLDSGREQELIVMKEDKKTGVTINAPIVKAVVANIERNGIDVMVVDPFVSTHGVNENDNGAIDKVAKLWAQIADHTNCAVDVVHHLRKVSDREATVEDARGAVSLIGAARSVRVLNRMSEEQEAKAGIESGTRTGYFSITYGKSNLTPLSHRLDWRKLESVALGNGRGLTKPQDHAPVVTEWTWPSAEEMASEVAPEHMQQIISRIRNSDCKLHHQADTWAGKEIAYVLGLDTAIKADASRVKRLLKAWIEDGTFVVVNRRCPIKRENKDFVEVAN